MAVSPRPHIVTDREGYCKIVLTIGDNVWLTIASNSRQDAVEVAELVAELFDPEPIEERK